MSRANDLIKLINEGDIVVTNIRFPQKKSDDGEKISIVIEQGMKYAQNTKESAVLNNLINMNELGVVYGWSKEPYKNPYDTEGKGYKYYIYSVEKRDPDLAPEENHDSKKRRTKKILDAQFRSAAQTTSDNLGTSDIGYVKMPDGTVYLIRDRRVSARAKILTKKDIAEIIEYELGK